MIKETKAAKDSGISVAQYRMCMKRAFITYDIHMINSIMKNVWHQ